MTQKSRQFLDFRDHDAKIADNPVTGRN